jgi:hypothetical protein
MHRDASLHPIFPIAQNEGMAVVKNQLDLTFRRELFFGMNALGVVMPESPKALHELAQAHVRTELSVVHRKQRALTSRGLARKSKSLRTGWLSTDRINVAKAHGTELPLARVENLPANRGKSGDFGAGAATSERDAVCHIGRDVPQPYAF